MLLSYTQVTCCMCYFLFINFVSTYVGRGGGDGGGGDAVPTISTTLQLR